MSAHQQDIDRAREQIHFTTQKADSYLTELTKRVEEYGNNHKGFEPAGEYLKSALDASRSATQKLKTQGQDLSERSVPVALDGMHAIRDSLDTLQKEAIAYDDKYGGSRGQHGLESLQHFVNSGRQHATDAVETANDQLTRLRDAIGNMAGQATYGAQVVVGEAVRAAEFGDEKLGVSSVAEGVVQKVRDLDARLGVTAAAVKVDSTITGGLGCKLTATTVDIVTESVNYISETLQNAKLAAQNSETAQSVEAKGSTVIGAAVAKKNEVQQTFTSAAEKGKEAIGMATEKTEEKAGELKDAATEKADQLKDKAGDATEMTKDRAGQAAEMAKEKTGEARDKASDVSELAKNKAGQAAEMAKEKTGAARQRAGEVTDFAKDKAQQTKDAAGEATNKTKEKMGDTKKTVEDNAGKATDSIKSKANRAMD